ncbi:MAG TPA: SEC-C metal-binding domain-containing protein [Bryobacteraceae bacterium]|nr:SEC-C metal-binding domain-containing protein [Bryobacteraceae bacterium]
MGTPRADLILDPERLDAVPVSTLLEAAGHGYIGVDHRFLHAIVDRPEQAIPGLVAFAAVDHPDHPIDLNEVLLDIFRYLKTPEAIPFLIRLVRDQPDEVDDDVVKAFAQVGKAAVGPLVELFAEFEQAEEDFGEIPFLLSVLQVRDPRILDALTRFVESTGPSAAIFFDFYGDPAAIPVLQTIQAKLPDALERRAIDSIIKLLSTRVEPPPETDEPFDIWDLYTKEDSPPLEALEEDDYLAMLENGSAELKADVAAFYRRTGIPPKIQARFVQLAKNDPDPKVRGECWEALEEIADEPEVRKAMLVVLADPNASLEEKGGAAVALAQQVDNPKVVEAIEKLYTDPRSRAKALKAMGRSFNRRFAAYPPKHLDDPDPEIKRQAIWAIGYLNVSSEAPRLVPFFDDDSFRSDALFAYAIAVPGETSRGRIRSLLRKVDDAAGGFKPDEEELVMVALDQRLMLHGMEPFFSDFSEERPDEEELAREPEPSRKVGRNDPCPCGSGKKYKKCHGA